MRIVHTLTLIDSHVALGEEAIRKIHNLLLRYLAQAVHLPNLLLPIYTVDEGIQHLARASLIVVEAPQFIQFLIVQGRDEQIIVKVATFQLI